MSDNTKRFSDRVDNYIKYRPSYPLEAVDYIFKSFNLTNESSIADIGSGTGILTKLLAPRCAAVYAVEPNTEMRLAAERLLKDIKSFISVDGTAEETELKDKSVDCVIAAQAFHWFDRQKVKPEFGRILKDNGRVILIWNKRKLSTDFQINYEEIIKNDIPEYKQVNHHQITPEIIRGFMPVEYKLEKFSYTQRFDWNGMIGRLQSSSYCPKPETGTFKRIEAKLRIIFDKYQTGGTVPFIYETEVYSGKFF